MQSALPIGYYRFPDRISAVPITIKIITTPSEMEKALAIRRVVFIEEQQVPEAIEIDEFEDDATYILSTIDGLPVGTARWRATNEGIKLERFSVLKNHRGTGIGAALLRFVLQQIDRDQPVYLNSQTSVIDFYLKFNFKPVGAIFYEAGIPHQKMILAK